MGPHSRRHRAMAVLAWIVAFEAILAAVAVRCVVAVAAAVGWTALACTCMGLLSCTVAACALDLCATMPGVSMLVRRGMASSTSLSPLSPTQIMISGACVSCVALGVGVAVGATTLAYAISNNRPERKERIRRRRRWAPTYLAAYGGLTAVTHALALSVAIALWTTLIQGARPTQAIMGDTHVQLQQLE